MRMELFPGELWVRVDFEGENSQRHGLRRDAALDG